MKINLIKEAEYEINEAKCTKIPFETFCKMSAVDKTCSKGNNDPKVMVFNNVEEFKNFEQYSRLDESKEVMISSNGNIFVYLKNSVGAVETPKTVATESKSMKNA